MIYTMEFMTDVCNLLDEVEENVYKIKVKKLTEKQKKRLISYNESIKMLHGEDKGIVNIDEIK